MSKKIKKVQPVKGAREYYTGYSTVKFGNEKSRVPFIYIKHKKSARGSRLCGTLTIKVAREMANELQRKENKDVLKSQNIKSRCAKHSKR